MTNSFRWSVAVLVSNIFVAFANASGDEWLFPNVDPVPSWLQWLSAEVDVEVERVSYDNAVFDNVHARIEVSRKQLGITSATASLAGGTINGTLNHVFADNQTELRVSAANLRSESVPMLNRAMLSAPVAADLELSGASLNPRRFAESLSGQATLEIGMGVLDNHAIDDAGKNLFSLLVAKVNPFSDRKERTAIGCGGARLAFHQGVAEGPDIIGVQTGEIRLTCDGRIDLRDETLGLTCQPEELTESFVNLGGAVDSIQVHGSFGAPRIKVLQAGVLSQGASIGAGFALFEVPGIADLFVSSETMKDDDCQPFQKSK